MARRYKKRRSGSRKMTVPLAVMAPIAAIGVINGKELMQGDYNAVVENFTGYNMVSKSFNYGKAAATYTPLIIGVLAHRFIGPSVNRALGRAKVPFIRL